MTIVFFSRSAPPALCTARPSADRLSVLAPAEHGVARLCLAGWHHLPAMFARDRVAAVCDGRDAKRFVGVHERAASVHATLTGRAPRIGPVLAGHALKQIDQIASFDSSHLFTFLETIGCTGAKCLILNMSRSIRPQCGLPPQTCWSAKRQHFLIHHIYEPASRTVYMFGMFLHVRSYYH